jgi:hypothetical protein
MSGNSFTGFNSVSPQMIASMQMQAGNNFMKAFQDNYTIIPKNKFNNEHNVVHDNLGNNLMTEQIETYTIFADGFHRNHVSHCNPFDFPIEFGGTGSSEQSVWGDELDSTTNPNKPKWIKVRKIKTFQGSTGVKIGRPLHNIKFVKVQNIVCPGYNKLTYDFANTVFKYETDDNDFNIGSSQRFITLKIKEFSDPKNFTSGEFFKNDSYLMKVDKYMGDSHVLWIPLNRDIVSFKNSLLKDLSKISIKIYDDEDSLLEMPILTYTDQNTGLLVSRKFKFDTIIVELNEVINNISSGGSNTTNPFTGVNSSITDVLNTISQINKIKRRHQVQVSFDVGVVENELNTETKY